MLVSWVSRRGTAKTVSGRSNFERVIARGGNEFSRAIYRCINRARSAKRFPRWTRLRDFRFEVGPETREDSKRASTAADRSSESSNGNKFEVSSSPFGAFLAKQSCSTEGKLRFLFDGERNYFQALATKSRKGFRCCEVGTSVDKERILSYRRAAASFLLGTTMFRCSADNKTLPPSRSLSLDSLSALSFLSDLLLCRFVPSSPPVAPPRTSLSLSANLRKVSRTVSPSPLENWVRRGVSGDDGGNGWTRANETERETGREESREESRTKRRGARG